MQAEQEIVEIPEVAAGIAWLDENVIDWASRIELDKLDLQSISDCVACQVTGIRDSYQDALENLGILGMQQDLGFSNPRYRHCSSVDFFKYAEAQWRRAIADRLPPVTTN